MSKLTIGLSIALAFAAGCVVASRPFVVPPARAANVQRWDYLCFDEWQAPAVQKAAAAAGAEGWELAAGINHERGGTWCLKRPR